MNKISKREVSTSFKKLEEKYTNQTLIQVSENDVGIGFGYFTFDENGEELIDMHTMMRMSHGNLRKLYSHLTTVITQMDDIKK